MIRDPNVSILERSGTQVVSTPEGAITTTVRGSHIEVHVRLARIGRRMHYALIFVVGSLMLWVGTEIVTAFTSGRVAEILGGYR
jgi:hypothetical protein